MKVEVVGAITLEMSLDEARTLYQLANWGDPVAELVGEESASKQVEKAVANLLDDLFEVLKDTNLIAE